MPSSAVAITDAAWVQIMPASTTAFGLVSRKPSTNPDLPMSPVKWKGSAAQPGVADTDFSYAYPGDQINGLTTEPVWAIAVHAQGSEVVVHDQ